MRRKLAAGNWKMNGTMASGAELKTISEGHPAPDVDILICPPATLIAPLAWQARGSAVAIGGQDCHTAVAGAHTGDISAEMLRDAGASHVILGHSERRTDHGETNDLVRAKAEAALAAGLIAVICMGETLAQREAGETLAVVGAQLAGSLPDAATGAEVVIAYEPVWAVGSGLTPSVAQIGEVHGHLRQALIGRFGEEQGNSFRLLYGGSVKAGNAAEIFAVPDVDGALVGGASLKAADFLPIIQALEAA